MAAPPQEGAGPPIPETAVRTVRGGWRGAGAGGRAEKDPPTSGHLSTRPVLCQVYVRVGFAGHHPGQERAGHPRTRSGTAWNGVPSMNTLGKTVGQAT